MAPPPRPPRPAPAPRAAIDADAAGGIVLIAATLAALAMANGPLAPGYAHLVHAPLGPLPLERWVNDGLMALFFLMVGCEIRRAAIDGPLADPAARRLPVIAAAAGMAVPALVYLAVTRNAALARGWAIPAATDIAFAVGIMALLGPRVPASLRLFLTTVAIADDMGAVAIIALVYSGGLDPGALAAAAGVLAAMWALGRRGVGTLAPYLVGFALLWALLLRSGVHATVAGVLTALVLPARAAGAPIARLERALHPVVAFAIVPLFAFVNAGVALGAAPLGEPLVLGIAAGLFVGKQVGVLGGVALAERLGWARRPPGIGWRRLHGAALLAGIGFTMSLFIGALAFPARPDLAAAVKTGVLAGSLLSALSGYALLRWGTL